MTRDSIVLNFSTKNVRDYPITFKVFERYECLGNVDSILNGIIYRICKGYNDLQNAHFTKKQIYCENKKYMEAKKREYNKYVYEFPIEKMEKSKFLSPYDDTKLYFILDDFFTFVFPDNEKNIESNSRMNFVMNYLLREKTFNEKHLQYFFDKILYWNNNKFHSKSIEKKIEGFYRNFNYNVSKSYRNELKKIVDNY